MRLELCTVAAAALLAGGIQVAQAQDTPGDNSQQFQCEKPWTQIDADNNGMINKEEAGKVVDAHFKAIDTNGDGKINEAEYVNCLSPALTWKLARQPRY